MKYFFAKGELCSFAKSVDDILTPVILRLLETLMRRSILCPAYPPGQGGDLVKKVGPTLGTLVKKFYATKLLK